MLNVMVIKDMIWKKKSVKDMAKGPVLLVSHDFSCSGAPLVLLELAKRLKTMGFAPMFVSPSHGPLEDAIVAAGFTYKVVRLASLKGHDTRQEQRAFADFVSGFKLVIMNTLASSLWVRTFKSRGTRVILWTHEGDTFLDIWQDKMGKMSKRLPLFDRILCVSEYAASAVRRISKRKIDIEIFPYGIPDRADDASFELGGSSDKIRCVVGGSIEPRKGQDLLIDALLQLEAHELERLDVVIAGRETSDEIVEKIDGCGLSCVRRMDALPQDEWLRHIAKSDVLICPSRDDPMPVVATEAMMFSKVVLVSDHTGTASLLEDGVSGFVVPADDSHALALAIRKVMASRSGFAEIGRRVRRVYEENFTIDAFDGNIRKVIC